jgi:oligosaccharyltransferase complex subunit beta
MLGKIPLQLVCLYLFISLKCILSSAILKEKSLVLLDDWHYLESHSMLWEQLRSINIDLDFRMIHDENIQLTNYGEYIYQSIIFFAPSLSDDIAKKNDLKLANIVKFIDSGHDIMIFANTEVGNYIRKLANEFGVDFDDYVFYV